MNRNELRNIVISALGIVTGQPEEKFNLPDNTPFTQLGVDSMAFFSVLLTIEKAVKGDLSVLTSDTSAPKTLGHIVDLAAKVGRYDCLKA